MSVRQIEVDLAVIEDNILDSLGYREHTVLANGIEIIPKPQTKDKELKSISSSQLDSYKARLGGQGTPIGFYSVKIARSVAESTVRQLGYWTLTRDGIVSTCIPVDVTVKDSRYNVILAVIKIESEAS